MTKNRLILYATIAALVTAVAVIVVVVLPPGAHRVASNGAGGAATLSGSTSTMPSASTSTMPSDEIAIATNVAEQEASFTSPDGSTTTGTWPSNVASVLAISTTFGSAIPLLGTGAQPEGTSQPNSPVILIRMTGTFTLHPAGGSLSSPLISIVVDPTTGQAIGVSAMKDGVTPPPSLPTPTVIYQA